MTLAIDHLSAGRSRSVLLTTEGHALACGAVQTWRNLPAEARADLCIDDPSEIGHQRFAQPVLRHLNPDRPLRVLADGPLHALGVCAQGDAWTCLPLFAAPLTHAQLPLPGLPAHITQLQPGEARSHALDRQGRVWHWGLRHLGAPTPSHAAWRSHAPGKPTAPASRPHMDTLLLAPQVLPELPPVQTLATGAGHVLALSRHGELFTWGLNAAGQLGHGDLQARSAPRRLRMAARIVAIDAGDTHSLALDERGQLWAWGANHQGQLGPRHDGQAPAAYEPRPVRVRVPTALASVHGGMHYSVARTRDGEVFTWGWNGLGQLGQPDDTATARLQARRVPSLRDVQAVSAGQGHVLAHSGAQVLAWGDNRSAACGLPATQAMVRAPHALTLPELARRPDPQPGLRPQSSTPAKAQA